jgi:hypothetical protein
MTQWRPGRKERCRHTDRVTPYRRSLIYLGVFLVVFAGCLVLIGFSTIALQNDHDPFGWVLLAFSLPLLAVATFSWRRAQKPLRDRMRQRGADRQ